MRGLNMPNNEPSKKERFAVIHVKTNQTWLTSGGECSEEEGWKEIEDRINQSLTSMMIELNMSFLEWDTADREGL